jgi:hypothetical protein
VPFLLPLHEFGNPEEFVRLNRRWLAVICSRGRVSGAAALLILLGAIALVLGPVSGNRFSLAQRYDGPAFSPNPTTSTPPLLAYRHLPLIFERNQGQSDPRVKFLVHGSSYGLFLTDDSAVLSLRHSALSGQHPAKQVSALSMTLSRTNLHAEIRGENQLPGKSNYFIGNDPANWHRDIPQFAGVRYANIYPGIDLVFYGNQGRLEYDFELAPGSDPRQVALRFAWRPRARDLSRRGSPASSAHLSEGRRRRAANPRSIRITRRE